MKPIMLLALLLAAMPVNAKPFYRSGKFWKRTAAVSIIVGINLADAKTTCDHQPSAEPRLGRGCATAIGVNLANAAFATSLYAWEQHYGRHADWKPEIFLRDWSVPMIEGAVMGYATWHNLHQPITLNLQK